MNVKSIYATPSNLDRVIAAFDSAVSEFCCGVWIPFAVCWLAGIVVWFIGIAQETQGWAELFQIGGQAALDGYFATVHAERLTMLTMMSDALAGHSVVIGGVLRGWGIFIAVGIVPPAFILSLAGATISAYLKSGDGYRRR
ncbi:MULTISPECIES: hypothetical protein [Pandoraea]|uniref:Uncharacterized protein n=2 Tax=Pandoraea TaxID=93217 RepID=A0A5E4XCF8_9BURK|nr:MULTISPECIES: hypothetical protein [Pandoraea]VVE16167.1 hypothetical protein PCE31107_02903 [Pandoraea cepalis]VVE33895.1 hypothetical protein PTE31013_03818 [Pandoraea terrigena]